MSLKNIIHTIEDQARQEAGRIIKESEKKAREIKDRARKEAETDSQKYMEESERRARMESGRILTQARLDKRLRILAEKKEIIDAVIEEAFTKSGISEKKLQKTVVTKKGEQKESWDKSRIKEDLRPELEKVIGEVLEI